MPHFRDSEKQRYARIKAALFSDQAAHPGMYKGKLHDFCLANAFAVENLHPSLRDDALRYFHDRRIQWHDGTNGQPSPHLCSSQVACVNTLWPLTRNASLLAQIFRPFLPDICEVLPFDAELPLHDGATPYLAFEWIGTQNYLKERGRGTRGANATSPDFAFRFRREDGRVQLVLGEWKYTENYGQKLRSPDALNPRQLRTLLTQLSTYRDPFTYWNQRQPDLPSYESFFVEPFYQLMRLTLLAQEMERAREYGTGELDADIVSVLHIAPQANHNLASSLTSPKLKQYGRTVSEIWTALAPPDRFLSIATERLISRIDLIAPQPLRPWTTYLKYRYGW